MIIVVFISDIYLSNSNSSILLERRENDDLNHLITKT